MNRQRLIFILSHAYPAFIALHVLFGDWCVVCRLTFNIAPLITFGGLMLIWGNTSNIKLSRQEKVSLGFLVLFLGIFTAYYCLCTVSSYSWVNSADTIFGMYVILTIIYYAYIYYCDNTK